ncbi:putative MFS family arabinose efflux permease [Rhodococcus sp. AG1013]|uniref:MFS transporter n=1 Tax=Rhodococcus sp. AG1013 TaxID=2183996 RepID=UPI000E0C609B|nr:MFS transporter [Rhodococcus sp. AG1013]RDI20500.1 putative MFS family arabinose efflux permease [Rhodococcus sp. AG1013]
MFAALRSRNYRYFATGQIVSLVGTWMQRLAQDWLVLTLSGGDGFAVGVVMALQFGPTLFLSMYGGVLADRYDKRRVLMVSLVAMAAFGLILGLLDVGGVVQLWHVYVLSFALGCVTALETPVRQSFTIEMVGPDRLANAIALNSMMFNAARIVGPAISGVLITLIGTGPVFLVNAASFVAVFASLAWMRADELTRATPAPRAKGQVRDGFRYVRSRADLTVVLLTVFVVSTSGLNFSLTLAVLARNTFDKGADAFGLLSTMLAIGMLAGATFAARRLSTPTVRWCLGVAVGFGVLETAVGFVPSYLAVALLLVPTGALVLTFSTAAMSILQMSVPSEMRGRVMGMYMLAFLGGTPLGGPLLGWLADAVDPRAPLVVGGLVSLATGLAAALYVRRSTAFAPAGNTV